MAKQASYKKGVEWIALNDDPGCLFSRHLENVSNMISVLLVADLFDKTDEEVAKDVIKFRVKNKV